MTPLRVHVLYEYSSNLRPHGTSFLRLIRPLSHPALADEIRLTCGRQLPPDPVDAVIVDRIWHPYNITPQAAEALCGRIRHSGARFIYAFDDYYENMSEKVTQRKQLAEIFNIFFSACDGALVTTPYLAGQYQARKPNLQIVPNNLDERLLVRRRILNRPAGGEGQPWVIGMMGTPTHDEDLRPILPALVKLAEAFKDRVIFDFIGILNHDSLQRLPELQRLPLRITAPPAHAVEYPLFMLWYTSRVRWEVALAPMENIPFNQAKSDIKVLDYAAIGAAGVFSDCPAYQGTIQNRQNGLLVKNEPGAWLQALTELLSDAQLRCQVQQQADAELYAGRVVGRQPQLWLGALQSLLAG